MTSFGLPAVTCFFCLRFLAEGMNFTRPALYIAICGLIIKAPLNYILIYGKLGLPEMGGVGCGVAQAIIMWFQLGAILIVVSRSRFNHTGWRERFSTLTGAELNTAGPWNSDRAYDFLRNGPVFLTTLLLGRYGVARSSAHNISMSINGLFFYASFGLWDGFNN